MQVFTSTTIFSAQARISGVAPTDAPMLLALSEFRIDGSGVNTWNNVPVLCYGSCFYYGPV